MEKIVGNGENERKREKDRIMESRKSIIMSEVLSSLSTRDFASSRFLRLIVETSRRCRNVKSAIKMHCVKSQGRPALRFVPARRVNYIAPSIRLGFLQSPGFTRDGQSGIRGSRMERGSMKQVEQGIEGRATFQEEVKLKPERKLDQEK